jgi:hypothetical protein
VKNNITLSVDPERFAAFIYCPFLLSADEQKNLRNADRLSVTESLSAF